MFLRGVVTPLPRLCRGTGVRHVCRDSGDHKEDVAAFLEQSNPGFMVR